MQKSEDNELYKYAKERKIISMDENGNKYFCKELTLRGEEVIIFPFIPPMMKGL